MLVFAAVDWNLVLGVITLLTPIVFGAAMLVVRDVVRREFAAKHDVSETIVRVHRRIDELDHRVQGLITLHTQTDDRLQEQERRVDVISERQTQQWLQISGQMERTSSSLAETTRRLEDLTIKIAKLL